MRAEHRFVCEVCGESAGTVQLDDELLVRASFTSRLTARIAPQNAAPLHDAILAGDARALWSIDFEFAPFYCRSAMRLCVAPTGRSGTFLTTTDGTTRFRVPVLPGTSACSKTDSGNLFAIVIRSSPVTNKRRNSMKMKAFAVQLAVILTLGLMTTAAFAQDDYRGDRISTQGRITSISRDGDMYRVTLNHGSYTYLVPVATVQNRGLQVGDRVRVDGIINGDLVTTDLVAMPGDARYEHDPMYRTVPYGQSGWMSGVVESVNRHMGYLTIRDDATGGVYKIDVRHMDRNRPINVWAIRAGDHISVNGGWENRDTFNAVRIEY